MRVQMVGSVVFHVSTIVYKPVGHLTCGPNGMSRMIVLLAEELNGFVFLLVDLYGYSKVRERW
jgi:hypothetical protein